MVLALFLLLPAAKLVHAPYRLAALLRAAIERDFEALARTGRLNPRRGRGPPL